jgi:nitroreductase
MTDAVRSDRITCLRNLRAVRQLRPDALPDQLVHNILEVGRLVRQRRQSTAMGVRGRPRARHASSAVCDRRRECGSTGDSGDRTAIVIHPEVPDLDAYDEGRLAERILLAAAAQDLGAAVGHFTGPGDTWAASAEAKRLLGVPERMILRETISIGYPAEHLERTPNPPGRKPLEQLVHWDHY